MGRGIPTTEVIAEIVGSGRGAVARTAFARGEDIRMSSQSLGEARVGDLAKILVKTRSARVIQVFGKSRAPGAVMSAFLADNQRGYPTARVVEREVAEIVEGDPLTDPGRRDCTAQDVVTIDPDGAKDHDDAIAASIEGDNVRIWVHIADVSHYVLPGTAVDRDAARRGCSVYVPGLVDPMLPARLSSDLCSLRPGVVRRVITVEMLISADGRINDPRFYRSAIRSQRRCTYSDVDAHFAGATIDDPGLAATIAAARIAAERLHARRMERGALELGSNEPVFVLSETRVEGVRIEEQTPSHSLVEECMIAANEAVAGYLIARKTPTVFRYHEDPEQHQVDRLYAQLAALSVATPPLLEGYLGPSERRAAVSAAAEAVGVHLDGVRARGEIDGRAVWVLVLRALKQAYYSADSVTHSGLASPAYLHFTSPIRRYPDLLVHRALVGALGIGPIGPPRTELEVEALASSESERAAVDLERRADRICAAILLERELQASDWGTVFSAEVTGMISRGAFLRFGVAYEGFLPASSLSPGELVLDEQEVGLLNHSGDEVIRLGDHLEVRVAEIDALRGRVRLERADAPAGAKIARSRAQRRMARRPR